MCYPQPIPSTCTYEIVKEVSRVYRESDSPNDRSMVRKALRAALLARGHALASDTLGRGRELYVAGDNDLAQAVFVLGEDAGEVAETMYLGSGSWVSGMPPRFAVLPTVATGDPSFEMLEQIGATPLLYELRGETVTFLDLETALALIAEQ
jgi:hypothetical protein